MMWAMPPLVPFAGVERRIAWLRAILLGGLLLNALLGWWWADPIAALVMVPIILNEGREALLGETCDACP